MMLPFSGYLADCFAWLVGGGPFFLSLPFHSTFYDDASTGADSTAGGGALFSSPLGVLV